MELHNYMENIVLRNMERVLAEYQDICKCDKCKLDIAAIALNRLQPHYTVTEKGKLFTKVKEMEIQNEVDVIKEITRAIELVSKKPYHDVE